MLKNKILEKLLAIILIFTLTFTNFAFVSKAYASTIVDTIFGEKSETGHENIGFEAYFGTGESIESSVISDVNNEELAIGMKLNVLEKGYLKDAKIAIVEAEEGKGLNFELKEKEELDLYVQSVEDNVITLQQINSQEEDINFVIPIKYKNETYVAEEKLSKDFIVAFTGIYVDNDGDEIEVAKEVKLNLSWTDSREVNVETSVEKYIDFGEGVILQTLVKVNNSSSDEDNSLPVKESEITITAPTIEGVYPTNVYVVANSTLGTNGKNVGEVNFTDENWEYNQEENKLNIKVSNEKELVKVDEFEDEYLQDAEKEIFEEERFFNGSGVDEYLVTYTFMGIDQAVNEITTNSEIEAKQTIFSGVEAEENNVVTNKNNYENLLDGKIGDIVSLNIEDETEEVSKAYTYVNYNNSEKYEVELKSETIVNISYTEIVEGLKILDTENVYVDKEGKTQENKDIYYKQISLSKENFTNILGEDGEIKILDISGNVLNTINKDSKVEENGNIEVKFNEKYAKLNFQTSKPIGEGNLVINNIKAMSNTSLGKSVFANMAEVKTKTTLKADYAYVETDVEIGTSEISTKLVDTVTKANLVMDRESLSTLERNDNVELRIELNNAVDTSDVYGDSVFEITLPESIESFETTNTSLLYAEGLEIVSSEVVDRKIKVTITGKQIGINSGVLTNGTNIVINANIKVNLFTPAKTETMVLTYTNAEATNYENNGSIELPVNYSAPTGVVSVNSISNYNDAGSTITSVRQGAKEDLLAIYSGAKVATMELIVMNNNENAVSKVAILGRIPFAGVKDIISGDELGTTSNTKLVNGLVSDEKNQSQFKIYYSENGEASKDLTDSNNGWTEAPENFDNIKSYLIVPLDENYEMKQSEIIRFTYQYEIPGNLAHNEDFFGTFATYYTNNSEIAVTEEQSIPDKVGLTTGKGPEIGLAVSGNREYVREHEEFIVTLIVTNVGEDKVENVDVSFDIPKYTTYVSHEVSKDKVTVNKENNKIKVFASELQKDEEVEVKVTLNVNRVSESNAVIKPVATITAKDLGTVLTSEGKEIKIIEAEFEVTQYNKLDIETTPDVYEAGEELSFRIYAKNLTENTMTNVVITEELPAELIFVSASIIGYEADGKTSKEIGQGTFDEATRTVTWNVSEIKRKANVQLRLTVKTNNIDENLTIKSVDTVVKVKADGTDTYESNPITTRIGKPVLVVNQTTLNADTYIKEGEKINYIFSVKNEGKATAEHVRVTEVIPEGIIIQKMTYTIDGVMATRKFNSSKQAEISSNIDAGEELVVNVVAVAGNLNGVQEKSITNYAKVSAANVPEIQSNGITHIIEMSDKNAQTYDTSSSTSVTGSSTLKSNISKTYRVSGTAWLDTNENGMRDTDEQTMSGISAKLVNSESGVIQKAVTTDSTGGYTFSGVENGNYLVIFDYDTVKYTVTSYRKDGVGDHVNSDVVTTKLEQDGKTRNGAITDVISVSNGSISGVDIGFVLADTFDLALEKSITKLTVQSVRGTTTDTYENAKLAKTEIAAKYVSGATVYVEYEMKVTNKGDVAGYAKKIVDYLPEGMTFNSSLEANANWYTGTDGNIYSTALAENELAPGESATIKLVLTKQMTEENVGIVNNLAEIYDDYNIYGISDTNSTPANKAQGENDLGTADVVVSVKTGEVFIHISVIITSMLLGSIMVFAIYIQIVSKRRKGGV